MSWLLDPNALIALGWPAHEHHERMLALVPAAMRARAGEPTSALTQAAFVRVISQPAFSGQAISIGENRRSAAAQYCTSQHRFLALDFGIEQVLGSCTGGLRGHRQITDAWLLTLAMRHGARLLTFDSGIAQLLATAAERQRHIRIPD